MSQDLANTSVSREALSWKGNWQTATPPTGGTSASVLPGASSGHHYTHYGCIFIILTFSCVITALNCFNTDLGQIGNNVKQFSYNTKLMANLMKNNISLRHLLPQSLKVPPCGFERFQLVILLHQRQSLHLSMMFKHLTIIVTLFQAQLTRSFLFSSPWQK